MTTSDNDVLDRLAIDPASKTRKRRGPSIVVGVVAAVVIVGLIVLVTTRHSEREPIPSSNKNVVTTAPTNVPPPKSGDSILTVSGYVIPRERIEISPKFQGTVRWIGVKKGDVVKKDDVLVRLEDEEYRARVLEASGSVQRAVANLLNAEIKFKRQQDLASNKVESVQALDDSRRERDAAKAEIVVSQGQLDLAQTYLDWCTIRAPIDGTILEKLVNPNELVVPQSFGGGRGPSTAFLAMADLTDLQVEIDLNEADTPKVHLQQRCAISPEAYPDKKYSGRVAEIAPEANRAKGTLQVKVQVESPDQYLTPELTAKVDFLAD